MEEEEEPTPSIYIPEYEEMVLEKALKAASHITKQNITKEIFDELFLKKFSTFLNTTLTRNQIIIYFRYFSRLPNEVRHYLIQEGIADFILNSQYEIYTIQHLKLVGFLRSNDGRHTSCVILRSMAQIYFENDCYTSLFVLSILFSGIRDRDILNDILDQVILSYDWDIRIHLDDLATDTATWKAEGVSEDEIEAHSNTVYGSINLLNDTIKIVENVKTTCLYDILTEDLPINREKVNILMLNALKVGAVRKLYWSIPTHMMHVKSDRDTVKLILLIAQRHHNHNQHHNQLFLPKEMWVEIISFRFII